YESVFSQFHILNARDVVELVSEAFIQYANDFIFVTEKGFTQDLLITGFIRLDFGVVKSAVLLETLIADRRHYRAPPTASLNPLHLFLAHELCEQWKHIAPLFRSYT